MIQLHFKRSLNNYYTELNLGHTDVVQGLALLPDQSGFMSASNDMTVKKWDLESEKATATYTGHEGFIYSVSILPRNKGFISSGEDRSLRVWEWDEENPTEERNLPLIYSKNLFYT